MKSGESLAGRYRLGAVIGAGTYGVVYSAQRLSDGSEVAIKTLRREMTRNDAIVQRFELEAHLASRLDHPNLIAVLDVGRDPTDGAPYIVQPLLRGVDLAAAIASEGPFAPRVAVDVMVPVLAGLLALHREGIVHRDVKPSNIFLVRSYGGAITPTLLDFGIAKFLGAGLDTPRTITGQLIGTPAYMAPEQVDALRDVDERCDVWAAGVVLFELITGKNPFLASTFAETLRRVKAVRAPSLSTLGLDVSPALSAIVDAALEPARERRIPSMNALLTAIFECAAIDSQTTGTTILSRHQDSLAVRHAEPDGGTAVITLLRPSPSQTVGLAASPSPVGTWMSTTLAATVARAANSRGGAVQLVEGWEPEHREGAPAAPATPTTQPSGASRRDGRPGWVFGFAALAVLVIAALIVALASPRSQPRFVVRVTVRPGHATVTWDGARAGVGYVEREVARDGRVHTLRFEATGLRPHTVVFRDAPPPAALTLSPP